MPARLTGFKDGTLIDYSREDRPEMALSFWREARTVYFISTAISDAVKIGSTSFPVYIRQQQLQTGNHEKLLLLLEIPTACPYLESDLHVLFKKDQLLGEWFQWSPRMQVFIDRFKGTGLAF